MLPNVGFSELIVIFAVALLLFGCKRLPKIVRGIGQSMNAFKKSLNDAVHETNEVKTTALSEDQKKA